MNLFRVFLAAVFITVISYTIIVGKAHGWDLFSVFFGDIKAMNWSGQFNVDFSFFLIFTGLWMAWRHHFTIQGMALGLLVPIGGIPYVCVYLFILSLKENASIQSILIGNR